MLPFVDDPERTERLRQLLSAFNHCCRNSLNGIKMSLYLSKRDYDGATPPCWTTLERTYHQIEQLFERLHMIYRPLTLTMVRFPLGQLIAERLPSWRALFASTQRTLNVEGPEEDGPGDFDPMLLAVGLDAFVAWRAEEGSSTENAGLSWRVTPDHLEITWTEERLQSSARSEVSGAESGGRMTSARQVDCLALPLLARIVSAHGGRHETTDEPGFGLKLRWPRFHDPASQG